jgi:hypothetical protein
MYCNEIYKIKNTFLNYKVFKGGYFNGFLRFIFKRILRVICVVTKFLLEYHGNEISPRRVVQNL